MSSARQRQLAILRPAMAVVVGLTLLTGCGAGQIAQTAVQESAANGAQGQVGPMVVRNALLPYPEGDEHFYPSGSDAHLVLAIVNTGTTEDELTSVTSPVAASVRIEGQRVIPAQRSVRGVGPGGDEAAAAAQATTTAPTTAAQPTSAAPTAASPTGATGPTPTSAAPAATTTSATASSPGRPSGLGATTQPNRNLIQGEVRIVLEGLAEDVRPGKTIRVTFLFRQAGELTLEVPIGPPDAPRTETSH